MTRPARFASVVALTLVLGGVAQAQDLPAVPAADAITPRKLELANELIEATGAKSQMKNLMQSLVGQIAASAGAKLSPDDKTKMQVIMSAEGDAFAKRFPEIQEAIVRSYAETYSEKELSDILAFYKSPSGQAMTAKAPALVQGMVGTILKLAPQIQHDAGQEICAKITCTAAQKAAFMGEAPAKP
jgi:hypothetical protein